MEDERRYIPLGWSCGKTALLVAKAAKYTGILLDRLRPPKVTQFKNNAPYCTGWQTLSAHISLVIFPVDFVSTTFINMFYNNMCYSNMHIHELVLAYSLYVQLLLSYYVISSLSIQTNNECSIAHISGTSNMRRKEGRIMYCCEYLLNIEYTTRISNFKNDCSMRALHIFHTTTAEPHEGGLKHTKRCYRESGMSSGDDKSVLFGAVTTQVNVLRCRMVQLITRIEEAPLRKAVDDATKKLKSTTKVLERGKERDDALRAEATLTEIDFAAEKNRAITWTEEINDATGRLAAVVIELAVPPVVHPAGLAMTSRWKLRTDVDAALDGRCVENFSVKWDSTEEEFVEDAAAVVDRPWHSILEDQQTKEWIDRKNIVADVFGPAVGPVGATGAAGATGVAAGATGPTAVDGVAAAVAAAAGMTGPADAGHGATGVGGTAGAAGVDNAHEEGGDNDNIGVSNVGGENVEGIDHDTDGDTEPGGHGVADHNVVGDVDEQEEEEPDGDNPEVFSGDET